MAGPAATPLFLEPEQGQAVRYQDGPCIIKVNSRSSGGAFVVYETLTGPGQGPTLHRHAPEDEFVCVLDGQFEFQCAARHVVAASGAAVYVPRGTAHRWRNQLSTRGRLLTFRVPGGSGEVLDARSQLPPEQQDGLQDTQSLACEHAGETVAPADAGGSAEDCLFVEPGAGTVWNVLGDTIVAKFRSHETRGQLFAFEDNVPPQAGPPLHIHRREDEVFYILQGVYEFRCRDQSFRGTPGSVVMVPHGLPHTFRNIDDAPGKLLVATIPSGLDRFFEACDRLSRQSQPSFTKVMELGHRHGLEFLLPSGSPELTGTADDVTLG